MPLLGLNIYTHTPLHVPGPRASGSSHARPQQRSAVPFRPPRAARPLCSSACPFYESPHAHRRYLGGAESSFEQIQFEALLPPAAITPLAQSQRRRTMLQQAMPSPTLAAPTAADPEVVQTKTKIHKKTNEKLLNLVFFKKKGQTVG